MESDDILVWNEARLIQTPKFPWQVMQIGNCGSPIETEMGWLLLTHGVGPMRQYCIGATLLDRDDPSRVIGQTREPLITANEEERWGYVPNVVYSCGAMVHNRKLILPYAMSDLSTRVARIELDEAPRCALRAIEPERTRRGPRRRTGSFVDHQRSPMIGRFGREYAGTVETELPAEPRDAGVYLIVALRAEGVQCRAPRALTDADEPEAFQLVDD